MNKGSSERQLHVFVSSTFEDMQMERRILVGNVFPRVAEFCHQRKWEFTGVDLRWGISNEQAQRGETVDICISEIDHCRPLFIGMLGERYGWIPDGEEVSVTEREIIYGALDAPDDTEAFFYIRSPELTTELYGSYDRDIKQDALKERIRNSAYSCMNNYSDLDSFAEQVYVDLIGAVERITESNEEIDPVAKERANQLFLAKHNILNHITRPELCRELDDLANQGGTTIVTGNLGCGKTSLLSEWLATYEYRNDVYLFVYFIGSSPDRGWETIARQLIGELNLCYGFGNAIPEDKEGLRRALYTTINMAAKCGKLYIVLDGIDALAIEDSFGLSWLPEELPQGVSIVMTANEGDILDRLRIRKHKELRVESLSPDEVRNITINYLKAHSKQLDTAQLEMLRNSLNVQNPLYLLTVLNEIIYVGKFATLTKQLGEYLACEDIQELFDKVLNRMDCDYQQNLCRRMLILIEASRSGLTDAELLSLLGDIPYSSFAPIYYAIKPFIAVCSGAIHITSPEFRESVYRHYNVDEYTILTARHELIRWFTDHPDNSRRAEVLPWLLNETEEYGALYELISEPAYLSDIWHRNRYELYNFWSALQETGYSPVQGYQDMINEPEKQPMPRSVQLAELLVGMGQTKHAKQILEYCINVTDTQDKEQRAMAYGLLGNLYQRESLLNKAKECYEQKRIISAELCDTYEEQRALGNLGLINLAQGNIATAKKSFETVLQLAVSINQRDSQQIALGNLGNIAFQQGAYSQAEQLYQRQRDISIDSGNVQGIINSEGALGLLFLRKGELDAAEQAFTRQESQSRRIGAADGIANALGNLAIIAQNRNDYVRAEELQSEKLEICNRTGQLFGSQNALGNLAALCSQMDKLDKAIGYARQRVELTKTMLAFRQLAHALIQLAELERMDGHEEDAKQHEMIANAIAEQHAFEL